MASFKPVSFIAETISIGGEPSRAEHDFAAEHKRNAMTLADVLREMRWAPSDLDAARVYGFPAAASFRYEGHANPVRVPVYSRRHVEAWREAFKSFSAKVR
jgi:hypothetical protein